jgi:hypothetical protein
MEPFAMVLLHLKMERRTTWRAASRRFRTSS